MGGFVKKVEYGGVFLKKVEHEVFCKKVENKGVFFVKK